ncbi:MAG: ATP-binding protein [Gammaproteobacteria bacterium]|nr:ATP-binding protein [Gammaproteobacteria bacterium]
MPTIYLIEGPVGSGKSTIAMQLSEEHSAPRLILDEWMAILFNADRPAGGSIEWYMERKERCLDQILKVASSILLSSSNVVLELGLIRQSDRFKFYEWVDLVGVPLEIAVVDAPREIRRDRVKERNRTKGSTYFMEVPEHIFEVASDMWEPVDESEYANCVVTYIETDT